MVLHQPHLLCRELSPFLPSVILISSLSVLWNRLRWGVQFPLRKAESLPAPTQAQAVAKNRQDHVSNQWETWIDGVSALSQSHGTAPSPYHPGAESTFRVTPEPQCPVLATSVLCG